MNVPVEADAADHAIAQLLKEGKIVASSLSIRKNADTKGRRS
jgi:hypothetical protein